MVKCCIAAGCSNTNADGVSLFHFPRNPWLCVQWNKQAQRTHADWKEATEYSVLCSKRFTNDYLEEHLTTAAQFGISKRKRLIPDAIPTIFHRPATATSWDPLQEGPSVGHKQASVAGDESIPVEKKKPAFEKRERELGYVSYVDMQIN